MWRHYVYVHRRADSGAVFYVGKGTVRQKLKEQVCERAFDLAGRNKHWHRIVAKHGLIVEVIASFRDDGEAMEHERRLIAEYGRATLANLTDGGDGCAGINPSPEARAKLSDAAKRPRSAAWVQSIRAARKNGGNGGVVKRGDKLPTSWKANLAAAKVGPKNPMYGKRGPMARAVIDFATGDCYPTVEAAAAARGLKMKTLYNWLSGHRPNVTTMRFA